MPPRRPSLVGAHVASSGGLARGALRHAVEIGAEAIQVFLGNPRSWASTSGDPRDDRAFREGCRAGRIPTFVHASYLINPTSASQATRSKSFAALRHTFERATAIGAAGVVLPTGSVGAGTDRTIALSRLREGLLPLLEALPASAPTLLIEPTAGGANALVRRIEQLGDVFDALGSHERIGVCLDTCQAWAAGHDLAAPGGVRTLLNLLVRTVGRGRLGLIHANDSRDPIGSARDRPAAIGTGAIGADPFRELFVHPATRDVPLIIEAAGSAAVQRRDLALLRQLRDT